MPQKATSTDSTAHLLLAGLLAAAAAVFCLGITWGLPSRDVDPYLFGDEPVWPGEKIQRLAGDRPDDPTRGTDVDVDPLTHRRKIICLNQTDEQRAKIIRRYRLYTYNPDEMVTMMALARMNPSRGDLDPGLYQYGGLWVYAIGAGLRLASLTGAITLTGDLTYYLDHPEAFGRFYVVARLYVVAWALVGVWAVFRITRRLTGGCRGAAATAAACYIAMPVVVNLAHEAKPHLPGAVLMLLAVMAAMRYVDSGKRRWWIATGCLCGAAFGMVLAAWPIFILLPVMTLLRPASRQDRITRTLISLLAGGVVYCVTNPYVLINLFTNRELLQSNLANTRAMFELGSWHEALPDALWLTGQGTSVVLAVVGAIGATALAVSRHRQWREPGQENKVAGVAAPVGLGWLLAAPALLVFVQFCAFAAGQPAEYARFAVFGNVALAVAAVVTARQYLQAVWRWRVAAAFLLLTTALPASNYLAGFVRDASFQSSRISAARNLQRLHALGASRLGVLAEPAPYVMPPVDLFEWQILLLPQDFTIPAGQTPADVLVRTRSTPPLPIEPPSQYRAWPLHILALDAAPISWGDKGFDFMLRKGVLLPSTREAEADAP